MTEQNFTVSTYAYNTIKKYKSLDAPGRFELLVNSKFIDYRNNTENLNPIDSDSYYFFESFDGKYVPIKKSIVDNKLYLMSNLEKYFKEHKRNMKYKVIPINFGSSTIVAFFNFIEFELNAIYYVSEYMKYEAWYLLRLMAASLGAKDVYHVCLGYEKWYQEVNFKKQSKEIQLWVDSCFV